MRSPIEQARCPLSWTLGVGFALFSLIAGCSQNECRLDETVSCTGANGCRGHSVCGGQPRTFQACECDSIEETHMTNSLLSSSAGAPCTSASDCLSGEVCLSSESDDVLGGGPPHGICVAECTEDATLCDGYSGWLTCVQTAGQSTDSNEDDRAYCFPACSLGDGALDKCGGRDDLVCDNTFVQEATDAFCRPLCLSDSDCGQTHCDRGTGTCTQQSRVGNTFGDACDPHLGCDGLCVSAETEETPAYEFCSHRCAIGISDICAWDESGTPSGYCHLLGTPDNDLHDTGFCEPLCDCNADCIHPDAVCSLSPEVEEATGRRGTCTAPGASPVTLDECPPPPDPVSHDGGLSDAGSVAASYSLEMDAGL